MKIRYILEYILYKIFTFPLFALPRAVRINIGSFFGFLFIPINFLLSIFANSLSRRYEYESDLFAVKTYGKPEAMIMALKNLTVDNLGNLTPHSMKVFLHYSHPPVLKRVVAIRETVGQDKI